MKQHKSSGVLNAMYPIYMWEPSHVQYMEEYGDMGLVNTNAGQFARFSFLELKGLV